jgi:hypothetical protein
MEEDDIEEVDMEEDVVEDLRFSTNTSNVTHITVIVSTIVMSRIQSHMALIAQGVVNPPTIRSRPRRPLEINT